MGVTNYLVTGVILQVGGGFMFFLTPSQGDDPPNFDVFLDLPQDAIVVNEVLGKDSPTKKCNVILVVTGIQG